MRNTSQLKQKNLLDIIKVIRKSGTVTKPEIAKQTNLTAVTAHNFICELIEMKVVNEVGCSKSNGGRKAALYGLNDNFGYIIGQNLGRRYITTTICDINLKVLYKNKVECYLNQYDITMNRMLSEIVEAISLMKLDAKDCHGIGITLPGQVNHESGVVINLLNASNWTNIPIKSIVESKIGIETHVDNDNNATAIAAKWLNIVRDAADAVFITISDGVGTGVLSKGSLFYGNHSYAGEIGHTTIQYDGPLCSCGNKGCIEALTSDYTIIDKVKKVLDEKNDNMDISDVIRLAKAGNDAVYNVLKETSFFISIAIDHLVKIYDPEIIVIQCYWLKEFNELFYMVVNNVFERCKWVKRDNLTITVTNVENIESSGPASLVLEKMFAYTDDNSFISKMKKA